MRDFSPLCGMGLVLLAIGCTTVHRSNTPRTGVEQLLISNAIDQSLDKIDFAAFTGVPVYLEEKYVDCVDKAYLLGSIRHRLAVAGAHIVPAVEKADVLLEVRSGGVGTDGSDSFVGLPEITLPGMLTLPEVRLMNRSTQNGTAKIGLVAYDARTMEVLGEGGVTLARSDDSNWFFMGVGPYRQGSISKEVKRATSSWGKPASPLPQNVAFEPPGEASELRLTSGVSEGTPSAE